MKVHTQTIPSVIRTNCALLAIVGALLTAIPLSAATRFWNGGSANNNWTTAANWGGVAPVAGDDLIFQANALVDATSLNNTNNFIAGTIFGSITIQSGATNYVLNGNQVVFNTPGGTGLSFQSGGANTANFPIQLGAATVFEYTVAGSFQQVNGPVNLNGFNLTNNVVNTGGELQLGGVISGTGGLVKTGNGTLLLDAPVNNTYVGITRVTDGTLELNDFNVADEMIPGDVVVSAGATLLLTEGNQIADTANVTVLGTASPISTSSGLFNLNGFSETIASLTLTGGGNVASGVGVLTLGGNVTASASGGGLNLPNAASITGNLSLGAATRTFSVSANAFVTPELSISAVISGAGGVIKSGTGEMRLSGANTYTGATTVSSGFVLVSTTTPFGSAAAGTELTGGDILLEGVTVANERLTNNSASSVLQSLGGVTSGWASNIVLNATLPVQVFTNGLLDLSGQISGSGGITKSQPGTLRYSGSAVNNYTGTTTVNEGTLELGKSAADGSFNAASTLVIGDGVGGVNADVVRNLVANQLDNTMDIVVNDTGLYDLDGFNETVDIISLIGGQISTGTGMLTMNDNMFASSTALTDADITGNLALGGLTRTFTVTNGPATQDIQISAAISGTGGIIMAGDGRMSLFASNSYAGLTTVNDGILRLDNDYAAGATAVGIVINGDGILEFSGSLTGAEGITNNSTGQGVSGALWNINGSNFWSGPVVLQIDTLVTVDTNTTLNLAGAISGLGDLTKNNPGLLYYSGSSANNYAGVTTVNGGTLVLAKSISNSAMTNNLVVGDGVGGINTDVVRTEIIAQLPISVAVTVNSSGLFEVNMNEDFGSLAGSGRVTLNAAINPGYNDSTTIFSGVASGTGSFNKYGTGTMTLSGANTHTGATTANDGILRINGSQPQSPVSVGAAGTLSGIGVVGNLNNGGGGVVAPGTSPGILTCSNATFAGAASDFTVEINGTTPGSGYDQLNVRGVVSLGGAALNVSVGGFVGVEGQSLVIVSNDAADAVVGTFNGLPEGAIKTAGPFQFRVSYVGGSGNDVTLTLTNPPLDAVAGLVTAGNGNNSFDPNECNLLYLVITNHTGSAISNVFATLTSSTDHVILHQNYSDYPPIPANGRGTNLLPFQLSTLPAFTCSDGVDLQLTVFSSAGQFGSAITLGSGHPGAPVQFTNSTFLPLPDANFVNSTNVVSGIVGPIAKVTVSVYLTHPNDGDLALRLIGPDGTQVILSDFNGGTGNDYGADCAPASYTVFDDAAATSITAGSPPYVGTFKAEGSLAAYIGKSGADVNGNWRLQIEDDFPGGGTGTLRCWVLAISATECAPGSGICDTCPGIVTNSITAGDSIHADRMLRTGTPDMCGAPLPCGGALPGGPYRYDTHVFTNSTFSSCVRVYLDTACENALSASVYLGSYNPTNICQNFLAQMGSDPSKAFDSFSFLVPSGTNFVVVVNEVFGGSGCDYTLVVTGQECPPPVLNISPAPANQVKLDWTTAAAGFQLEHTNRLVTGVVTWQPVTNNPVVVSGRFAVTNAIEPTNNFFRLRQKLLN